MHTHLFFLGGGNLLLNYDFLKKGPEVYTVVPNWGSGGVFRLPTKVVHTAAKNQLSPAILHVCPSSKGLKR